MSAPVSVSLRRISASTSEAVIRRHSLRVDRPADKGGEDDGPMGGELFLASIGGCLMSNLLAAIRARDLSISDVSAKVAGTLEGSPPRFTQVEVAVSIGTGNREEAQKLLEIADRGCIMTNTLRDKLDFRVKLAD